MCIHQRTTRLHNRAARATGRTLSLDCGTNGVAVFALGRHGWTLCGQRRALRGCRGTTGVHRRTGCVQRRTARFDGRTFRGVNGASGILCGTFGQLRRTSSRDCGAKGFRGRALRLHGRTLCCYRRADRISYMANRGLRRALRLDAWASCLHRRALCCLGRASGREGGALRLHRRTDCDRSASADSHGGGTPGYLRRTLGRKNGAFRCSWRARRGFGRANRDGCGTGGGRHMHDRHHRDNCFYRFPRICKRPIQCPQDTVQVQSHITTEFIEIKYGWTVITPFNVFPRTFRTVCGLQPSFARPFGLQFARIISGRKAKLGRAEVVERTL